MPVTHTYLGQVVPALASRALTNEAICEIKKCASREYSIWVGSTNAMKIDAARSAVQLFAEKHFGSDIKLTCVLGCNALSGIDEQPHGREHTETGAQNRLSYMNARATEPDEIRFYVTMENGVIKEEVSDLKNPDIFLDKDNKVWIDRCFVIVQVAYKTLSWEGKAYSDGVTTPLACVRDSEIAQWKETAGSFIKSSLDLNANNWHEALAGKGRPELMQEAIQRALGLK